MSRIHAKILSAFIFLATITLGILPTPLKAQGACCFGDVTIGLDFLYWTYCIGDMDYAVVGQDAELTDSDVVKTKYICADWDPGVRGYISIDNLWNGFNGSIAYTYLEADAKSSISSDIIGSTKLSTSLPDSIQPIGGDAASAKWKMEYQAIDANLNYPLRNICCDVCREVEAFCGIKWVSYSQERKDVLLQNLDDNGGTRTLKRELDVCGLGPVCGVNTGYNIFDCLKAFGLIGTSLIVGKSESKDRQFDISDIDETTRDRTFKGNDDCVCFSGLHLMSGFAYEACLCNMDIALRAGWEYIQWINAPAFPHYEERTDGIRSASSKKNLTLQGIFAGLNISF